MKNTHSRLVAAAAAGAVLLLTPVHQRAVAGALTAKMDKELCRLYAVWDPTMTQTSVPEPPERLHQTGNSQYAANAVSATFIVTYDANFPANAKAAFQAAVDIWASQIQTSVPITITANWSALSAGQLGGASGTLLKISGAGVQGFWYHKALLNRLAGQDVLPGTADITATFNSAFTSWYFGTDGKPGTSQYDFESVVLHELGHGLGFSGSGQDDGANGFYGFAGSTGSFPVIYDNFVENTARQAVLSTSIFPNPSVALHTLFTSDGTWAATAGGRVSSLDPSTGIYWKGASGVNALLGVRPRLDAKAPFDSGSNYSHANEIIFPRGDVNSLMTRELANGESVHAPGAMTLGIFQDEGWGLPSAPPVGSFDTPSEGSTVSGSIAVTGWALDNLAVTKVSLYRDANPSDPAAAVVNGRVFIGDASFVDGARPDIAAAFPTYPNATRAGWGYLMLTRGLIWDGKGPFKLYAIAFDAEGNQTTLGSKTITVNNATATKPFGSIDAPAAGATVSGNYPNTGWVLVPGTGVTIPASGVQVYIDTTLVPGTPSTSARSDISAGFPSFDTSAAGRGLFIDTTKFSNGNHTIGWLVTASNGQADGIGSRFIKIQNGAQITEASPLVDRPASALKGIDNGAAVRVATSVAPNAPFKTVRPDARGQRRVQIAELDQVLVRMPSKGKYEAYHVTNGKLTALPIGATIDARTGTFFWQTSPGYLGDHEFVVVDTSRTDNKRLTRLIVQIGS